MTGTYSEFNKKLTILPHRRGREGLQISGGLWLDFGHAPKCETDHAKHHDYGQRGRDKPRPVMGNGDLNESPHEQDTGNQSHK